MNTVDPQLSTPYTHQVNFGVERALAANWAVSATYVFVRGVHGLRAQNINLAPPTVLTTEKGWFSQQLTPANRR